MEKLKVNNIYNGDCLDIMKTISDGSIDLILTDLPYGTTRLKWDSVIPFDELWEQYERIIKDEGVIVLFANQPFTSNLIMSNVELYKYNWIWKKPYATGHLNANYRPMLQYEDICVFAKKGAGAGSKGNNMKYIPQGLIPINKKQKNRSRGEHIHDTNNNGDNNVLNSESEYIQKYTGYPTNILEYDIDRDTKKSLHPAQKPVKLLEYLIRTYSVDDSLVLDSCMGSGSTVIACMNTNRKYIGIELNEKYFNTAKERIELHKK